MSVSPNAYDNHRSLQITLDEVSFFKHSQSSTIWLGGHSQQLLELQKALREAFPDFHELSQDPERGISEFRPHLSLGQWKHSDVQASLQVRPLTDTCDPHSKYLCIAF